MYFRLYESIIPNVKYPDFDNCLVAILETILGSIYSITREYITPNIPRNSSENKRMIKKVAKY